MGRVEFVLGLSQLFDLLITEKSLQGVGLMYLGFRPHPADLQLIDHICHGAHEDSIDTVQGYSKKKLADTIPKCCLGLTNPCLKASIVDRARIARPRITAWMNICIARLRILR